MTHFYWDASALVKRYAPETGTDIVNHLFSAVPADRMMCLAISTGEIISVFVRKRNDDTITQADFSQALTDFRAEVVDIDDFQLMSVEDALIFESHPLIEKHSLNATDALILRSALDVVAELEEEDVDVVLITSDHRLSQAAVGEGLQTLNPESASLADLVGLVE